MTLARLTAKTATAMAARDWLHCTIRGRALAKYEPGAGIFGWKAYGLPWV